jgi:hypothetical protein
MRVFRRIFGFIMLLAFCASVLGAEPLSEGPVCRAFTADPARSRPAWLVGPSWRSWLGGRCLWEGLRNERKPT